jgi:hypothetical protein
VKAYIARKAPQTNGLLDKLPSPPIFRLFRRRRPDGVTRGINSRSPFFDTVVKRQFDVLKPQNPRGELSCSQRHIMHLDPVQL